MASGSSPLLSPSPMTPRACLWVGMDPPTSRGERERTGERTGERKGENEGERAERSVGGEVAVWEVVQEACRKEDICRADVPELLSRHYGLSPVVFRKHWRPHDCSQLRSPAVAALVLSRCDLEHETSSSELEQLLSDSALTLTVLIVHGCRMPTRFWERVGDLLLTSDAALTCLSVRRTAIGRDGALALANGLRGNTALRDLDFGETEVGKEGGEAILAMALRGNGSLRRLEVGQERLGRGGGLVVATMLRQNSALQALSLGANAMGPTAGEALAQAMERNCGLKTLVLMANQLGKECGKALGKALGSNSTLTALTVGPNRIGSEGGEAIARGLCGNASLRTLVLRANQMGPGVGVALGEALRGSSTLQRLTLGTNQIGDAGAKAIGEALRENGSLTALDLGDNQIAEDGAAAIAASVSCTTSLVSLALGSNRVGEKGAAAIASGLLRTSSLARLVLTANRIGPKGCLELAESLRHNVSITHLDLSANGVDDHAFAALVNVLGQSPLQSLRVKNNHITTIPLALAEARCLLSLDVSGNPLVHPSAEFVQQATFAQLQAHLRAHRSALSRLKLLVVGYQNAGKTCLCHALSRRPPFESLGQLLQRVGEDRSTHGIAIQAWRACKDPELNFNVFDFAGQPVYYSNHRNFLAQQQAVYVVVFRADLSDGGAEAQVRHWLNLIASQIDQRWRDLFVAGMAVKPAVIVVGTHVDQQQCTEALQEDHRAWFFALHQAQEYSQAVELHHQLLLIDHDHPATVDELRQWVVSTGRKQLERAPLGLDIVVNLFPRLDAIRHSATARPLFRTLLEFREVLLECNPQHPPQSIDDIGVEGLARSLQAMGELVLLEALGQVCVEPQRLFDMLAEFVQRQTAEMRDRDKQHVDHDMGVVTLQAIKAVCNRHNLKANLAVVSAESVVAALEMLDLCVEVKPGLYLFPSLLPDATSRRLLKNFFRDPVFRFDVQWQLESLHPINPQQSSSSSSSSSSNYSSSSSSSTRSSSLLFRRTTSTLRESAPASLMFGIHVDIVKGLGAEFDLLKFWSDGMYLKRNGLVEVAVISSAGSDLDAMLRLSMRDLSRRSDSASEVIPFFDTLVKTLQHRLDRSLFHRVSVIGVCPQCPGLANIDGRCLRRIGPPAESPTAVSLVHESDTDCQPFFLYPLRRLSGHFAVPEPLTLCSTDVRPVSSSDSLASFFASDLFLDPPPDPLSSTPQGSQDADRLFGRSTQRNFSIDCEAGIVILASSVASLSPLVGDAEAAIQFSALAFHQSPAPRLGPSPCDPSLWAFAAGIRTSEDAARWMQREFSIFKEAFLPCLNAFLQQLPMDADPWPCPIVPDLIQPTAGVNHSLTTEATDAWLVLNTTCGLFSRSRQDGSTLLFRMDASHGLMELHPAMAVMLASACKAALEEFLNCQLPYGGASAVLRINRQECHGPAVFALQGDEAQYDGLPLRFRVATVLKSVTDAFHLLDPGSGLLFPLASRRLWQLAAGWPGLREMAAALRLVLEAGARRFHQLSSVPPSLFEAALPFPPSRVNRSSSRDWTSRSFAAIFKAAVKLVLESLENGAPILPSLLDPRHDVLLAMRSQPHFLATYLNAWMGVPEAALLTELRACFKLLTVSGDREYTGVVRPPFLACEIGSLSQSHSRSNSDELTSPVAERKRLDRIDSDDSDQPPSSRPRIH